MRERRQPDPPLLLRVGGISALVAGALFFSTLVYAFGVTKSPRHVVAVKPLALAHRVIGG